MLTALHIPKRARHILKRLLHLLKKHTPGILEKETLGILGGEDS